MTRRKSSLPPPVLPAEEGPLGPPGKELAVEPKLSELVSGVSVVLELAVEDLVVPPVRLVAAFKALDSPDETPVLDPLLVEVTDEELLESELTLLPAAVLPVTLVRALRAPRMTGALTE